MPQFAVCVPVAGLSVSTSPCVDVDGEHYALTVVDLPAPGEVSFDHANQLFAYGFTGVLSLWIVGLVVGSILGLISRSTE